MLRNVIMMFLSIVRVVLYRKKKGVATPVNYGVASSLSWFKSICNLKTGITRIINCLLSKVNILNRHGQAGLHLSPPRAIPSVPT